MDQIDSQKADETHHASSTSEKEDHSSEGKLLSEKQMNSLHARILKDLQVILNRQIEEFFRDDFDAKLDNVVEKTLNDMVMNSITVYPSLLDSTHCVSSQETAVDEKLQ